MMHTTRRMAALLAIAAAPFVHSLVTSPALADDFTDRLNRVNAEITSSRRSDQILLPVIAKMTPPPKSVSTLQSAILLPPDRAGWTEAQAWATAPTQSAFIEALARVTQEKDWKKAYGFGQPYGIEGVEPALVQAGLYTDLGDPPTLAGARFLYIDGLDRAAILVQVEASRLTAEGRVSDAVDLLTNWIFFARQMCDRQFFAEAEWGLRHMTVGLERIRDVVYVDSRTTKKLDTARLRGQIDRLKDQGEYLDLGRMKFPGGNRAAAEQLIARLYKADGSPDAQQFAATMSRLGSTRHPLRLFSESGRWRQLAGAQARGDEARSEATAVFSDWESRWNIPDRFDRHLSVATAYSRTDTARLAALTAATPDMSRLMDFRDLARVENAGTRSALGVVGFAATSKNFPPSLTPIRPAWVMEVPDDIYNNTQRDRGGKPPLSYFVPVRDTADINGAGVPYEIEVFVVGSNFKVALKDDVFVLYSFGSDLAKGNARRVQNVPERVEGADYLMWPPVISLFRQHKLDAGDFK